MLLALNIALLVIGLLWIWQAVGLLRAMSVMPRPAAPDEIGADELSGELASIVIAARDEAGRIEETVRRALAQEGVAVEVIAVDDRSTDGTGDALDGMARDDGALRVVHVEDLPPGWLGKCHALHRGAASARGGWLLFLDADTHLEPWAVAGALAQGKRMGVEHVTLIPDIKRPTFWGQALLGGFLLGLLDRGAKVNRDHKGLFMGVGAFNLIERETYRAFGGHERLRLQVVDDMVLGLCVRKIGARTRTLLGLDVAEIEYGEDLPSVIRLFEKNGYAAVNYSDALLVIALLMMGGFTIGSFGGPALAVWAGAWAGWVSFGGMLLYIGAAVRVCRWVGGDRRAALLVPLAVPALLWAFVRSAALTRLRGGIVWRETFYPLRELKAARLSWRVGRALPVMEDGAAGLSAPAPPAPRRL